jgi:hypothetical protein
MGCSFGFGFNSKVENTKILNVKKSNLYFKGKKVNYKGLIASKAIESNLLFISKIFN